MSMPITEPTSKIYETSAQRRLRKQREAEERSRPPPATEKPPTEPEPLAPTSKGFKILSALGYRAGSALGAEGNPNALLQPIGVEVKEDKGGIGHESEKKRKVREEWEKVEGVEKRIKAEAGDYRIRVAKEREERRAEKMWWGAMKVLEGLEDGEAVAGASNGKGSEGEDGRKVEMKRPIKIVNLIYRPLIRDRLEKERERRMRNDLYQSLTRNTTYDDPEEDEHDKQAFGNEEEELEEEDEELEGYLMLEPSERLGRALRELRDKWRYCFWCKHRYEDEEMEGCPGTDEDSHG